MSAIERDGMVTSRNGTFPPVASAASSVRFATDGRIFDIIVLGATREVALQGPRMATLEAALLGA